MILKHVKLQNWRNFRVVDVALSDTTYILGANAAGKSNFLDVFRFLRDITKKEGGGLQKAIAERGGISKLRCLHARRDPQVSIEIDLESPTGTLWSYALEFRSEGKGAQRILVSKEVVIKDGQTIISRPDPNDRRDATRRTQTHLEQILRNNLSSFGATASKVWSTNRRSNP